MQRVGTAGSPTPHRLGSHRTGGRVTTGGENADGWISQDKSFSVGGTRSTKQEFRDRAVTKRRRPVEVPVLEAKRPVVLS